MVECCYAVSFVVTIKWHKLAIYADWHYADWHYADWHYAECRSAECRGAVYTLAAACKTWCDLTNTLKVHLHWR
jgi:hypothetical protein